MVLEIVQESKQERKREEGSRGKRKKGGIQEGGRRETELGSYRKLSKSGSKKKIEENKKEENER